MDGCRQHVVRDVGLSPATSETPVPCCQRVKPGTVGGLTGACRRKVGVTSRHPGAHDQGYIRTNMDGTKKCEPATVRTSQNAGLSSDCTLRLHSLKAGALCIADQHAAVKRFPGLLKTSR